MKIKSGDMIEVTFTAKAIEDIDSAILVEWLFDNVPNMKVFNPSWREIKSSSNPTQPTTKEREE